MLSCRTHHQQPQYLSLSQPQHRFGMTALPSDSFLNLIFDNGSKSYKLKSIDLTETAPSLVVLPTVKLGHATAGNARQDHPLFGEGEKGSLQVMPCVVGSFIGRAISGAVPTQVAVKWARGMDNILVLAHELTCYKEVLQSLQGIVIPYCYGCYVGYVEGLEVGCLVLEWCAGSGPLDPTEIKCVPLRLYYPPFPMLIPRGSRQRMITAIQLHSLGIMHNGLYDPRHWVPGPDGKLRIVDFSRAKKHSCLGSLPLCVTEYECPPKGCPELDWIEGKYGIHSGDLHCIVRNLSEMPPREIASASSCSIQ